MPYQTSLRLPDNLASRAKDKQKELSEQSGLDVTFTDVVRLALESYLKDKKKPIKEQSNNSKKSDSIPYQKIVELYHEVLPELPKCIELTTKRRGQIAARWNGGQLPDLDTWRDYFDDIRTHPFLMGKVDPAPGRRLFKANLEWLTNESNFAKVAEGKYRG